MNLDPSFRERLQGFSKHDLFDLLIDLRRRLYCHRGVNYNIEAPDGELVPKTISVDVHIVLDSPTSVVTRSDLYTHVLRAQRAITEADLIIQQAVPFDPEEMIQ